LFFQSLAYQTRKRDRHKRKEQATKIYKIAGGPLFAISNSKKRVKYCYSEHKKHTALSATNKREEIIEKKSSEKQARLQVREIMAMTVPMLAACVSPPSDEEMHLHTSYHHQTSNSTSASTTSQAAPKYGTIIQSRIFVGGIDFKTTEDDLREFFSKYGSVRDARIIRDRAEVSKGYNFRYGFVTYETQDSVDNALKDSDSLNLHGKKLNIGRAVRKQQPTSSQSAFADPMLNTWMYHPGGYASLTGQSGVTYFVAPTNQVHQFPGYSMNQAGIIPPYTYVRNCQTTASQYNNQIMRNMVQYSGTFPAQYYATPQAHAIHALQAQQAAAHYAMYQQQQVNQFPFGYQEFANAGEGEANESYENDALAYTKQLQFGDVPNQLTPPDTPQE